MKSNMFSFIICFSKMKFLVNWSEKSLNLSPGHGSNIGLLKSGNVFTVSNAYPLEN